MTRTLLERYLNPDVAASDIANRLSKGELALFLGAGISDAYGLPLWKDLVINCCARKGVNLSSGPIDLQASMDKVLRACGNNRSDFTKLISEVLYEKVKSTATDIDGTSLMRSLGVCMMGGTRGSITEVVTVNFDSLLESHLQLHGYKSQSITSLPSLEGRADVRIYHPNGYLPDHPSLGEPSDPENFVIDSLSFDRRLANSNGHWNVLMRSILLKKVGIVVGISTAETLVRTTISGVSSELESAKRPVCYWLLARLDRHGVPYEGQQDQIEYLLDRGCVPIVLETYQDYPSYILNLCKKAAKI